MSDPTTRDISATDLPAEVDVVGQADPSRSNPPTTAGGIGGTSDGTQVPHVVPGAIPGKPMPPLSTDPTDRTSLEGQTGGPAASDTGPAGGSGG